MLDTGRFLKDARLSRSVLGVDGQELDRLHKVFQPAWRHIRQHSRTDRINQIGAGRPGGLPSSLDKLVFILMYCKCYPTMDVMGFLWGLNRSQVCRWVHKLLPALERALGHAAALPRRQIRSVEEFFQAFPGAQDIFVDGTERPRQRPKAAQARAKTYSGKKKQTTRKLIVMTDEKKRIGFLSSSKSGRRHDKRLLDKSDVVRHLPDAVTVWADTGFQGLQHQHPNTMMPKKAKKNQPLSPQQKQENQVISGIRVVVEHAIAGIKRLACMAHAYRNRKPNTDDRFAQISCGLWNFHLQTA